MENEVKSTASLSKAELQTFNEFKIKWKELSEEDIILDGLYSNSIRFVNEYFERVLKKELPTTRIIEIGLKSALQLLADRDLRWAEKLFTNMGFDSNTKIKQICFFTPYKELRDFLIEILTERKLLDKKEMEIIDYLHELESTYKCYSIEQVKNTSKRYKNWNEIQGRTIDSFIVRDIVKCNSSKTDSHLYGHYVLEWFNEWSVDCREKCLLDGLIDDISNDFNKFSPNIVWNYLIELRNFEIINLWFKKSFLNEGIKLKIDKNVDQEMIDFAYEKLKKSNEHHKFSNQISKFNQFATNELSENNFKDFIYRLASSMTFYNYQKSDDFHLRFIEFSLQNNFPVAYLWSYMSIYNNFSSIDTLKRLNKLNLMSCFRNLLSNGNLYEASFENLKYYTQSDENTIQSLLNHETLSLSAFATVFLNKEKTQMDTLNLDRFFECNPSLRLTVKTDDYFNNPTSVYQLLQEHTKLDVSKFFIWQKANKLKLADDSNDLSLNKLISHENAEFSKQYAYRDTLDYSFFLKQGRPFYAHHVFINSQLNKYGKIKTALTEEARLRTHLIAINNCTDKRIVSACCMFSEMVKGNTLKIKLNIYLIKNIMLNYYKMRGLNDEKSYEKCKSLFIDFLKSEIDAKKMLNTLENALIALMSQKYDANQLFDMDSCTQWMPIMCFSKVYNLPYSLKYLDLCASSNEWLMFLIFSQIHQIPRNQVLSSLDNFKDIGLKQHLEYALHNVMNSNNDNSDSCSKNDKKAKKKKKTSNKVTDMLSETSESESEFNVNELNNEPLNKSNKNESFLDSIDFYELLIKCQNSKEPSKQLLIESLSWHAPILSIFSMQYDNHDKISCLTSYLYASMAFDINLEKDKFDLNDLSNAIQLVSIKGSLKVLLNALQTFLPGSLIESYVKFLYHVFGLNDFNVARTLYSAYKYELIKITLSKHQLLIPLEWYENIIGKLTRISILKCQNIQDLNELALIMGHLNEYRKFTKLVYTLKANKINTNTEDWLNMSEKSEQFVDVCIKVLEDLLKMQKFHEAEELADYCELNKDRIYLAKIGHKINELRISNDFEEIIKFWKNSNVELMKIGIKDTDFIEFLNVQYNQSNLSLEKIILLNQMYQLNPNDLNKAKDLWNLMLNYIKNHYEKHGFKHLKEIFKKNLTFNDNTKKPLVELVDSLIKNGPAIKFNSLQCSLNNIDLDALNTLFNILIDIGKLKQAFLIARHYQYFNRELRVILNMLYVVLNIIKPEDIDYSTESLDSSSVKGIRLTNVLRTLSQPKETSETNDRLNCLQKLCGLYNCETHYCKKIKLYYQISEEFKVDFSTILDDDKWNILKSLLALSNSSQKYDLAYDFVSINEFDEDELCNFLLDEITNLIRDNLKSFKEINTHEFSKLIRLFRNPAYLGTKLLERTKFLLISFSTKKEDFEILIELLIKSHECFIQSCSMDGISKILQLSKEIALRLEKEGEFNIMIRLLTGIGHYNEMTYIMDSLWDNHQFEIFFGKRISKDNKLKLALLDYLKSYHPNDHETYTMVTLNFTMYREIAKMLEDAAYQQLRVLESKQIENSPDILTDLQSILQYFGDAAQSYLKEDCVRHAENCIKKARLIALQINFLSSNKIIINLTNDSVTKFIINHNKFWEAFMVAEAYEKKTEWSKALFNQFIVNNNEKYLNDFKNHIQLSNNLIEEIANRYKTANEQLKMTNTAANNMKKILKLSKDITLYYKLALHLDFKDLLDEIRTQKYASILNDFISNKKL